MTIVGSGLMFAALLEEFEERFARLAPQKFAALQPGCVVDGPTLARRFRCATVPDELVELYGWRNGFAPDIDGWTCELYPDRSYTTVPLDDVAHYPCIDVVEHSVNQWIDIADEPRAADQPSQWRAGFVPFLELQSYGLVVIDTEGRFGTAGQLLSYSYRERGGPYHVVAETLHHWLHEQVVLLREGLFLKPPGAGPDFFQARVAIQNAIHGSFWARVGRSFES